MTPRYKVYEDRGTFYVAVVNDGEHGAVVSKRTAIHALADQWCRALTRAAQVEADRKRSVKA